MNIMIACYSHHHNVIAFSILLYICIKNNHYAAFFYVYITFLIIINALLSFVFAATFSLWSPLVESRGEEGGSSPT